MAIFAAILVVSLVILIYKIYNHLTRISISDVPGPEPESFILGNLRQYHQSQAGEIDWKWQEAYGDIIRFKGPFGEDRLLIADPKTLQYVYQTVPYTYIKQKERRELSRMLSGPGLLWADGQDHKRMRKIMSPAFGMKEIRALLPVFVNTASELSSKWADLIQTSPAQEMIINLASWFSKATLDAIGIAAFDYHFGILDNAGDELGDAYTNLSVAAFGSLTQGDILKQSLVAYLPMKIVRFITANSSNPRLSRLRKTGLIATRVAKRLIEEKAKAFLAGKGSRDVLSLLVKANASEDEMTRMSEDEMIAVMRTLLLAGHETTATSLTWIMLEIARHPLVQTRLRNEIYAKRSEIQERGAKEFSENDFDSMPYLNAVIKEGLRFHPAPISSYREASKDDVLPLHKPISTRSGKVITELPVPKGLKIVTSINGYNRHRDIFGPDAHVYDPDRWLIEGRVTKAVSIGTYANILTFTGGARSCIGWRFAVLELQAFVVELIAHFEFSMTPEAHLVRREACLHMTPTVAGELEKGTQLPLMVRLATPENANL